jgi:hypothetical protein
MSTALEMLAIDLYIIYAVLSWETYLIVSDKQKVTMRPLNSQAMSSRKVNVACSTMFFVFLLLID